MPRPPSREAEPRSSPADEPRRRGRRPSCSWRRTPPRTDGRCRWRRVVVPLVGLTGGMGAGKSTALAALARLGAAVLSTDTVVHELYARRRRPARCGAGALGPRGRAGRRRRSRRDRRHAFASEERAPLARGSAVAARRRTRRGVAGAGARAATGAAGRGRRGATAVRGRDGGRFTTRRSQSSRRRTCASSGRRAWARARRRARRAPALPGGEGATSDLHGPQQWQRARVGRNCRGSLTS